MRSISILGSRTADSRASGKGLATKLTELKCVNCHSCPPPGSADRLSDTANRMVNMGLRLQGRHVSDP